jgi:hypothetical protein
MRPGMLLTLAASWLVLSVTAEPLAAKTLRPPTAPAADQKPVELRIEGRWQSTVLEAWQSAEAQVQVALQEHLRQQGIAVERMPSMQELRPKLVSQWTLKPDEKLFPELDATMYRVTGGVPVTAELRKFVIDQDREFRAQGRMLWLGKILAGLVVLLTAGAGYFRLDEWTKGYYTTWLRIGAAGFVSAAVIGLLLIA